MINYLSRENLMHIASFLVVSEKWRLTTRSTAELLTVSLNTTMLMFVNIFVNIPFENLLDCGHGSEWVIFSALATYLR
jgi:hypothetical protein